MNHSLFRHLGILLAVTVVLLLFGEVRMAERGQWLPQSPQEIGCWTATDTPIPPSTMELLGGPLAYGRRFTDPFNERVEYHVIATASYRAYHPPAMCTPGMGYTMTAEKLIPLFGKDKPVRAMILKSDNAADGQRILMYYWIQYKNGSVGVKENSEDSRHLFSRVTAGLDSVVDGSQSCIVRAFILIHPADPLGVEARRNLNEICLALYDSFKKDGEHT